MTSTDRTGTPAGDGGTPLPRPDPARGREIYALDRAYVFHSWSAQARVTPLVLTDALGSFVWDADGNRYLDFSSQMVNTNIGHQHPAVVEAIREQASRLCTIAPQHANDRRGEAARRIVERSPFGEGAKVFFTNAGAEAVEHAVRMARLHTGRPKVLAAYRSYHGATGTAINLTGDPRRWANDTGTAGVQHFFGPFLYRSAFHSSSTEEESSRALEHLEQVIALEGPVDGRRGHPRDGAGHVGDHAAASRLPRRGARALRPARDRLHRRRGDVRLRPLRRVVRVRPLGRRARPDHLRQGGQLRLRAARRRRGVGPGRRDLRRASLSGRAHLLGPPAGVCGRGGDHRRHGPRTDRRTRRRHRLGRCSARGSPRSRSRTRWWGRCGGWGSSGRSTS